MDPKIWMALVLDHIASIDTAITVVALVYVFRSSFEFTGKLVDAWKKGKKDEA